ncbi:acyl-CoA dehydrogenase family protein [Streptomyces sp. NPDC127068]|uniref:acyl-CoA dehydrogenase family protein n=1 Tax=Streptomyces sp. NPDC127068 TaxID=3347127 RepID=UPI00365B432D
MRNAQESGDQVRRALADFVHDGRHTANEGARRAVAAVLVPHGSGPTHTERVHIAYEQLRGVIAELGTSREIARDPDTVFSLFDWAAVSVPDLFPLLSGHFNLTVGALERLGRPCPEQDRARAALDDGGHIGVFLLTELGGGSNTRELRTEARWDPARRRFTLHTPKAAAVKFMPNVGDERVPRIILVAARLMADGRDEGVFLFLSSLWERGGRPPTGMRVHRMPDTGFCPMDHALIHFDGAVVPEDGLLTGGIAHFDEQGRFHSSLASLRDRYHHTIEPLRTGRVALARGAVAAARAGLWLTVAYAHRRRTAGGVLMIDRDNVRIPLTLAASRLYAVTALGNRARAALADPAVPPRDSSLLAMLAKPLLSETALSVLQQCRERLGAQGMFRANMITDYLGITQGVITAEGDNQVLRVAYGRALASEGTSPLPQPPGEAPVWLRLLDRRARVLLDTDALRSGARAVALAEATATAWAAHALTEEGRRRQGRAALILRDLAQLYGIDQVLAHADWYTAHDLLDASTARGLTQTEDGLLDGLARLLPVLTEAFGITPDLVPSAFVARDYLSAWTGITPWHRERPSAPSTGSSAAPDTE